MEIVRKENRPGGVEFEELSDLVSDQRARLAYDLGDVDNGAWTAGAAMGLINDAPTCKILLERLERGVEEIIGNLNSTVIARSKL